MYICIYVYVYINSIHNLLYRGPARDLAGREKGSRKRGSGPPIFGARQRWSESRWFPE